MAAIKSTLQFVVQSIVVGLALAFLVVLLRPGLIPGFGTRMMPPVSYADAVAASAPAVVNIYTTRLVEAEPEADSRPRFRVESTYGSGVIIDADGYIVTNYHVVAQATEVRVAVSDGQIAVPEIVGLDAETDLALLKVDLGSLPAVKLGSSAGLRIGDVVLAIGNPYGLTTSVTQGIVSGTGRAYLSNLTTFQSYIQTDAAINAGNSGGALINVAGELVGINTAVLARDTGTEGIGFAIPVDLVHGVVDEIKQHGRVIRGWLGMLPDADDLTSAERASLGIDGEVGIVLTEVLQDGPAYAANLQAGDVILEINGQLLTSSDQARLLVAGTNPGDELLVRGLRNGEEFQTTIVAAERPGALD